MRGTVKVTFQMGFKMNVAADSVDQNTIAEEGSRYGNADVYRKDFQTLH